MRPHRMRDSSLNELRQERAVVFGRCLPPGHVLTQGRKPEGQLKWGPRGGGRSGRRPMTLTLLDRAAHRAHLVQCEPNEASGFTNPNVGPGTYASLRLKLDARSSAVERGQKCSSPTRRLPQPKLGAYYAPSKL